MTQSLSHALKKTNTIISKGDFTERYYQKVPTLPNQVKVSPENFFIPKISEYDLLLKNNYKVPQLKKICKAYKYSQRVILIFNQMKEKIALTQVLKIILNIH